MSIKQVLLAPCVSLMILSSGVWSVARPAPPIADGSPSNIQGNQQPSRQLDILWAEPIRLAEPLAFYVAGEKRMERDIWLILIRPLNLTPFTARGAPPVQLIFNDMPTVYLWAPEANGYLAIAAVRSAAALADAELWAPPYGALAGQLSLEEIRRLHAQSQKEGSTLRLS